jgi:hypothetical protein
MAISDAPDETFRPYRHLAMRVLMSALRDAADDRGSMANRESALAFLSDSSMFLHWCRVAALDPRAVAKHSSALTAAHLRKFDDVTERASVNDAPTAVLADAPSHAQLAVPRSTGRDMLGILS